MPFHFAINKDKTNKKPKISIFAIGSRYHILNTLGMTLLSAELTSENTEIPLYDLSDGLYFFVIEGNENVVKFVKH